MASTTALISVRGEAETFVPPDFATLRGALRVARDTKADALRDASAELNGLTEELASLGGVPLTPDSRRTALTWAAYSAGTEPENDLDKETGRHGPTGRVVAWVSVSVTVRDFDLLDRLGRALASHEAFAMHQVGWEVDQDNPSWPGVRAAAIQDAIGKGHQYAQALGGSLDHLEHLADVGLLDGGGDGRPSRRSMRTPAGAFAAGGMGGETPSLDPVPQELIAIIDARFVASVAQL